MKAWVCTFAHIPDIIRFSNGRTISKEYETICTMNYATRHEAQQSIWVVLVILTKSLYLNATSTLWNVYGAWTDQSKPQWAMWKYCLNIDIHVCWKISKPGHQHSNSVKTCLKMNALKPTIKNKTKSYTFLCMWNTHYIAFVHVVLATACCGANVVFTTSIIQAHSSRILPVGGPCSIPKPSMSHTCCLKYQCGKFFFKYLGFLL